jgi:homocysteine S-methyltransferase
LNIRKHLQKGLPLVLDGAMGTLFAALPRQSEAACESANLDAPHQILAIHKAYLQAGANAIQTNTFSLSAAICQGRSEDAQHLLKAGCDLAKQAVSGTDAAIFADIGPAPLGMRVTPAQAFIQHMDWFLQEGFTCFLLETLTSDEGIAEAALCHDRTSESPPAERCGLS